MVSLPPFAPQRKLREERGTHSMESVGEEGWATRPDGTKAVLYESKAGSTTIAIQDAAGRTVTKIRY